tara:strand:+ start:1251 stop:1697 length:447 start_codon:yes stop_codon:yes gene_type:complete
MATLTPTLTLTSTDVFTDQPLALSVTDSLTVQAPMTDISRMNTDDNLGYDAGVIIDELDTNEYFFYAKHTGILSSDGTTAANATADYVLIGNGDADAASQLIKLYPGEFCFMTLAPADGSDGGVEVGGIKVAAGGAEVQINYAYWKRS